MTRQKSDPRLLAMSKKDLEAELFGDTCILEGCGRRWVDHDVNDHPVHRTRVAILVSPAPPIETFRGADFGTVAEVLNPTPRARPIEDWSDDELLAALADDPKNDVVGPEAQRRGLRQKKNT